MTDAAKMLAIKVQGFVAAHRGQDVKQFTRDALNNLMGAAEEVLTSPAPEVMGTPEPLFATDAESQRQIDIINLRLYARLAQENEWPDETLHWSVFEHTLNAIATRLERLPQPDPWVDVKVGLPDSPRDVLVYADDIEDAYDIAVFDGFDVPKGFDCTFVVTHWRELPAPPETRATEGK